VNESYRRMIAAAIFAGVLVLYLITLSPGAFPGESAALLAQHAGLDPFPPMSHQVWGWFVKMLAMVPVGGLAFKVNVFSAFCGAAAVALIFYLVSLIPHDRMQEEAEAHFDAGRVGLISGAAAAVFAAVSIPVWIVGTRAHPAAFDVLLGLIFVAVVVHVGRGGKTWLLYPAALLYGIGTTEFATLITWAPVAAVAVLFVCWRRGILRAGRLAGILGCYLAGLSLYFLFARQYQASAAFGWRGFHTYFEALWFVWREQYRAIAKSVPQVGWLLVFIVTVLPGIIIFVRKRGGNRATVRGSYMLNAVLAVIGLAVLFNARIAPWSLLKWRPLLVTPYMVAATWMGYLAGYWYIVISQRSRFDTRVPAAVKRVMRPLYLPGLGVVVLLALVMNGRVADGRQAGAIIRLADEIVAGMGPAKWLVSDGALDDNIVITAHDQGKNIRLLSMARAGASPYLDYISTLFDDPRLQVMARIGVRPLLGEWLRRDPEAAGNLMVMGNPDLWLANGYQELPQRVLYRGVPDYKGVDAAAVFESHLSFWETEGRALAEMAQRRGLLQGWYRWAARYVSKAADNLGYALEEMERPGLAFRAYAEARRIDTNNVSALLNMLMLADREKMPEAAKIQAEFDGFVKGLRSKLKIWSLAYHFGYVRRPEAFLDRGFAWALSGKPNMAIADLENAVRLGARGSPVQLALATLYFRQNRVEESRKAYLDVLRKDPHNTTALLGLARIAMRRGDFDTARNYLDRLAALKVPAAVILLERVALESLVGNRTEARKLLESLVEKDPENMKAWAALAVMAQQDGDTKTVDRCLEKIKKKGGGYPSVRMALAELALGQGDFDAARENLLALLKIRPDNRRALELILQIDMRQANRADAEEHAEQLLKVDPENAVGNLVLGGLHLLREEYALAEDCFRVSLAQQRTAWALNELAWVLHKQGRDKEALPIAEEAVRKGPRNGAAWDTLGVVAMETGHYQRSREALDQAMSMRPGSAVVTLHIARLLEKQGRRAEALRLAESLLPRVADMPPAAYEEVRDLVKRTRGAR